MWQLVKVQYWHEVPLLMIINLCGFDDVNFGSIDDLMQERRNSIVNALGLRLSCTNPLLMQ